MGWLWGARPFAGAMVCAALASPAAGRQGAGPGPNTSSTADAKADDAAKAAKPSAETVEAFQVKPFENLTHTRSLSYLEAGLPAFIAERLAQQAPLRFTGGPTLLGTGGPRGAAPPITSRWIVEGSFARLKTTQIEVRVGVRGTGASEPVSAEAVRIGPKDAAPRLALDAALEAFGALPGLELAAPPEALVRPFGRDPYAFVLYGRGVAAHVGLGALARNSERAAELLRRSLLIDPRVPETRRYLGLLHLEAGRTGPARAMWAYALDVRPDYVAALVALASLERVSGLPSAREHYARVVQLDPHDRESRRSYGELLADAGQLDQAQEQLEAVIAEEPGDLRARRSLALVLAARHAGAELVRELERVVELDPDDLDVRMDLAAAYASVGRMADAETVYEEVLRRKPRYPAALKLAGDLARNRGDVKRATALYNKLRFVAPQDPRPVFLLGAAHYEAGNLEAAERMFTDGARYPGMLGDAYSNLGAIALRRGNPKEALWLLSRAAKRRPSKANVRYNYAVALFGADKPADALNELRHAAALDPGDATVRFFSGVVALRLGLLSEAEHGFREALRLDPEHEAARHNLGLIEPLVRPRGSEQGFVR